MQVIEKASSVYQGKLATEVVFTGKSLASAFQENKDAKKQVYKIVQKSVQSKVPISRDIPHLVGIL